MRTLIASCSAIAVAAGCASTRPVPPARAEGAPRDRWTITVPSTLRALPEVQALVRARGDRFEVQVVEFDATAGAAGEFTGDLEPVRRPEREDREQCAADGHLGSLPG